MLPSIALEGGPDPETVWRAGRSSTHADDDAVTTMVVALAGYFTERALAAPRRVCPACASSRPRRALSPGSGRRSDPACRSDARTAPVFRAQATGYHDGMTDKRLIGVYRDDEAASRAAEAAERNGARNVVRGARVDAVDSLQNEMREELEHTIVGPGSVGPFDKESTKGMARWVPACTIGAMVLSVPLAFIKMGDLAFATRLGIVLACAAAAGSTVGFVAGMAMGGRRTGDRTAGTEGKGVNRRIQPMAAEEGVVVGVTVDEQSSERVADAMAEFDPIRLDKAGMHGEPLSTLATESDPRE